MTKDYDIPRISPDYTPARHGINGIIESNRKATNKSEILLETCTYCGRKFPERSMAHIGIGVFKCRECLFGKEKTE